MGDCVDTGCGKGVMEWVTVCVHCMWYGSHGVDDCVCTLYVVWESWSG